MYLLPKTSKIGNVGGLSSEQLFRAALLELRIKKKGGGGGVENTVGRLIIVQHDPLPPVCMQTPPQTHAHGERILAQCRIKGE